MFKTKDDEVVSSYTIQWHCNEVTSRNNMYSSLRHRRLTSLVRHIADLVRTDVPTARSFLRHLLRLMSEIPEVNVPMVDRVKKLAQDPERVALAIMTLQYLIMMRPPAKEICLDAVEDMYKTNPTAKGKTKGLLEKHRPQVLADEATASASADVKAEAPPAVQETKAAA